jgi:hypothetical protein
VPRVRGGAYDSVANRIQLTSDGHKAYLDAVKGAFGANIDCATLIKLYGASSEGAEGRYSPAECIGAQKHRVEGKPDMAHVSTSYSERSNLTVRMHNRRFTRLTNAFSKKFENHAHMVAFYAVWYNWIRIHKTLRITPAMAAGLSKTVMDWSDVIALMDAEAPKPGPRGPYKKAALTRRMSLKFQTETLPTRRCQWLHESCDTAGQQGSRSDDDADQKLPLRHRVG